MIFSWSEGHRPNGQSIEIVVYPEVTDLGRVSIPRQTIDSRKLWNM